MQTHPHGTKLLDHQHWQYKQRGGHPSSLRDAIARRDLGVPLKGLSKNNVWRGVQRMILLLQQSTVLWHDLHSLWKEVAGCQRQLRCMHE
jgi:hypothetical protein